MRAFTKCSPYSRKTTNASPFLPYYRLAQWEGVSRKWYYVQRATGKSQWDVPTEPVILTPSTTPGSVGTGPTQAPGAGSGAESPDINGARGLFGSSTGRPILSVRMFHLIGFASSSLMRLHGTDVWHRAFSTRMEIRV